VEERLHINVIYTKANLVGYNSVADIMGSTFIRLAVVASQVCEIMQDSKKI